jgi:ATP-binding protein involved in chromosome partitioning
MNSIKHIIAVASGKGGVGKSTTAVNLALALKDLGAEVGLLDADIYGPSQQLMLGIADEVKPEQQDGKFLLPIMAHGLKTMSMGYLVNERTPTVWRGPMAGGALAQMLEQTIWGELDYLVIDMPPGTGDIQLTLSQKATVAGAVIVTTPQDIALLDAQKGIEMFRKVDVPILGIVENMAVHVCTACGHTEHIFGEHGGQRISTDYDVPLLGSLPLLMSIREQTDAGRPTVIDQPDSNEAKIYRAIAGSVQAALNSSNRDTVRQFPEITVSDD